MERHSGVLLHISSLPSDYGIGTFGDEARRFVRFLNKAGQTYWQILPLGHTGFGDSPYSSFSTFAGNPYFIDLDYLRKDGLLKKSDYAGLNWKSKATCVNYGQLYKLRYPILRKAVSNFVDNNEYKKFCRDNKWLDDYAMFMAIKDKFNGCDWLNWPKQYRLRDAETLKKFKKTNKQDIRFWKVIQYIFFKQWYELKKYANDRGIRIYGDCPIYVALDSSDVWSNREIFKLDKNGRPKEVAGVPPDDFTGLGQLWGNPLYNWNYLKKTNYDWWVKRVKHLLTMYDAMRIDHFIGIESYYAIKYGATNGRNGRHYKGPGINLINALKQNCKGEIIAEDLGVNVTDKVRKLLKDAGYPGMRILRYGFGWDMNNEHLTHNHIENCVVYLTSHDSETCMQWYKEASKKEIKFAKDYCHIKKDEFNWGMIKEVERSIAYLVIIPAQDLLGLGKKARMNLPSTVGNNWSWRINKNDLNNDIARKLYEISKENKRI